MVCYSAQNEKFRGGQSHDQLTETMDELRQQLSVASTGKESLQLVKKAQAKFRAIISLRALVKDAANRQKSAKNEKGKEGSGSKKGTSSKGRPLGGVTTPLLKGSMSKAVKGFKGKR